MHSAGRGRPNSRVSRRHLGQGRPIREFRSRPNRPYGLTCPQINDVSSRSKRDSSFPFGAPSEPKLSPEGKVIRDPVGQGEPGHLLVGVDEGGEVDVAGVAEAGMDLLLTLCIWGWPRRHGAGASETQSGASHSEDETLPGMTAYVSNHNRWPPPARHQRPISGCRPS